MRARIDKKLVELISSYHDEMLEFTKALIRIPTENPPGRYYRECVEVITDKLREIGLDPVVTEVPVSMSNLDTRYCLQSFFGQGERTLYFHGHYDVVPASDGTQFQPVEKGGDLFGRGSSDMKSGLTAMIFAVKAVKASGASFDGRIGLTIVPDEETGGMLGSHFLSNKRLLGNKGIGMLTPEPTSGIIWNANRGAISLHIKVKGKPAHVGLSYSGINAFEKMLAVAAALQEFKARVESRKTGFNIEPEEARRSILLLGGRCTGGTSFNVVPAECSFTIDRRINPEEDLETEKKRLLELFDRLRKEGIDLEVEILQEGLPSGHSENNTIASVLADSVETITGQRPSFGMCPGLLETRFYSRLGIPAFAYGPGLLSVSHGPNEFVKLEDMHRCTAIYALTALRLLEPDRSALRDA